MRIDLNHQQTGSRSKGLLGVVSLILPLAAGLSTDADAGARFETLNGGRVIARDGDNTGHPSVIRVPDWVPASERPDPAAVYYMYYGRHSGRYIYMKWASSISGSWTTFNLGGSRRGVFDVDSDSSRSDFEHVAHPDVVIDDDNQRFILFFHGKSQPETTTTGPSGSILVPQRHAQFAATSPYGLNFNDPVSGGGISGYGPVEVEVGTAGLRRDSWIASNYQRVFRYRGDWYSVSRRGILNKAPDPADPIAPNPSDPLGRAWGQDTTPGPLYTNDAALAADGPTEFYSSPGCSFVASSEFANHPENPVPGARISCNRGSTGERLNHVGARLREEREQLQVFFYVKNDPSDRFPDLYRIFYDLSDPDYQSWTVARDENGTVLFDVYFTPDELDAAAPDNNSCGWFGCEVTYMDPVSLGTSDVFEDIDGKEYLFFSFVSNVGGGNQGEGQIAAVRIYPECDNQLDDDRNGATDHRLDGD